MRLIKIENPSEQVYLSTATGINIQRFGGELNGANISECYNHCCQGMYEPFCILVPMKYRQFFAEMTHWYFRFKGAQIIFSDTIPNNADEIIFHSLSTKYPCAVLTITGISKDLQ